MAPGRAVLPAGEQVHQPDGLARSEQQRVKELDGSPGAWVLTATVQATSLYSNSLSREIISEKLTNFGDLTVLGRGGGSKEARITTIHTRD